MNTVTEIKPMTDDMLEAFLGCEFEGDNRPDCFEFFDAGFITGFVLADDEGVEVTITDGTNNSLVYAIEWTRAEHNRAILKAVRAAAFNAFSVRVFITVISMIGFVKAN